jgi:hypothetical protein
MIDSIRQNSHLRRIGYWIFHAATCLNINKLAIFPVYASLLFPEQTAITSLNDNWFLFLKVTLGVFCGVRTELLKYYLPVGCFIFPPSNAVCNQNFISCCLYSHTNTNVKISTAKYSFQCRKLHICHSLASPALSHYYSPPLPEGWAGYVTKTS